MLLYRKDQEGTQLNSLSNWHNSVPQSSQRPRKEKPWDTAQTINPAPDSGVRWAVVLFIVFVSFSEVVLSHSNTWTIELIWCIFLTPHCLKAGNTTGSVREPNKCVFLLLTRISLHCFPWHTMITCWCCFILHAYTDREFWVLPSLSAADHRPFLHGHVPRPAGCHRTKHSNFSTLLSISQALAS